VLYVIVVIVLWVLVGLAAVVALLARQGYRDWRWYLLGATLGPLFLPIAAERARRDVVVVERSTESGNRRGTHVTVVVGVDGSAESDQAVRDAGRLFGGGDAVLVLVAVVDPDVGEYADDPRRQAAHDLLADRGSWLPAAPLLEIGSGQPARVLLEIARAEDADALVVGRRGAGLSPRLLGSVAEQVAKQAQLPVVFAVPVAAGSDRSARATSAGLAPSHAEDDRARR
jgi:nucleotide-binding universal stress UspA family protein